MHSRIRQGFTTAALLLLAVATLSGCSDERIRQSLTSDVFRQDDNPELIDVLWVQDDRSPMYDARNRVLQTASSLFSRLDTVPSTYRLGIITGDMQFSQGRLQAPVLEKKRGGDSAASRLSTFQSLLSRVINLRTSARFEAFRAALTALDNDFVPRDRVPLVVIFVSDSDDKSFDTTDTSTDNVAMFRAGLVARKGGISDRVRVYSLNYVPFSSPTPSYDERVAKRCATFGNADIDSLVAGRFFDEFRRIAESFRDEPSRSVTEDLCGSSSSVSDLVDLQGLKLKVPKTEFPLGASPTEGTLTVSVTLNGAVLEAFPYAYDADKNAIVFYTAPPDGAEITATYLAK